MVVTDAAYEDKAVHYLKFGEIRSAQVMATLAVAEQLRIMNENTNKLYGTALGWKRDVI